MILVCRSVLISCLCFILAGASLVYFLSTWELGDPSLGYNVGHIYFYLFLSAKDLFVDKRTRSVGRKLMKLEVVNKRGEVASPYLSCSRNIIECLLPFTMFISPQLSALFYMASIMDLTFMIVFKKRIMDFFLGTRVVSETENYNAVSLQGGTHRVESQSAEG